MEYQGSSLMDWLLTPFIILFVISLCNANLHGFIVLDHIKLIVIFPISGDHSHTKLGDQNIQYSYTSSTSLFFCGTFPHPGFTVQSLHVGSWDDVRIWLWFSTYHWSSSYWCISSLFHQSSFPPQNPSMYFINFHCLIALSAFLLLTQIK